MKKSKLKAFLASVLSVAMMLSLLPAAAFADEVKNQPQANEDGWYLPAGIDEQVPNAKDEDNKYIYVKATDVNGIEVPHEWEEDEKNPEKSGWDVDDFMYPEGSEGVEVKYGPKLPDNYDPAKWKIDEVEVEFEITLKNGTKKQFDVSSDEKGCKALLNYGSVTGRDDGSALVTMNGIPEETWKALLPMILEECKDECENLNDITSIKIVDVETSVIYGKDKDGDVDFHNGSGVMYQAGLTVNYFLEENGTYPETPSEVVAEKANAGTEVSADSYKKAIEGYAFDYADPASATVTMDGKAVLNLYYSPDVKGGGEDGKQPDGIPDKYQIFVEYKAETGGSVTVCWETINLTNPDGKYIEAAESVLIVGSTAKANTGYEFVNWTEALPEGKTGLGEALKAAVLAGALTDVTGGTTYVFTANFKETVVPPVGAPKVKVEKTVDKTSAKVGDTLTYTITVSNIGDAAAENLTVVDPMDDLDITKIDAPEGVAVTPTDKDEFPVSIPALAAGAKVVITAQYEVEDEDAGKTLSNTASVGEEKGTAPDVTVDPKDPVGPVDPTDPVAPSLTITKEALPFDDTDTAENPHKYTTGETVSYRVVVTNTGKTDIEDIEISDSLENAEFVIAPSDNIEPDTGDNKVEIEKLAANTSITLKVTYVVTEADTKDESGILRNVVVAEIDVDDDDDDNDDDDDDDIKIPSDPADVPVGPEGDLLSIDKQLVNTDKTYVLGDTLEYTIVVKNLSARTLSSIQVIDPFGVLVKGEGYELVKDETGHVQYAGIASLAAGASVTVKSTHVVTSADIAKGSYKNIATASVEEKTYQDDYTVDTDETNDNEDNGGKLDDLNTTLTVVKDKITEDFKAGETVEFTVTVTNNGTVEYTNVVVKELLSGALFQVGEGYSVNTKGEAVIESLAPNASVVIPVKYTATDKDFTAGKIVNKVSAKADPIVTPDNKPVTPEGEDSVTVPAEEKVLPEGDLLSIDKQLVNTDKTYKLGETLEYNIVVKNLSARTLSSIKVIDPFGVLVEGEGYELMSNSTYAEIESLAAGASVTVKATHVVSSADIAKGSYKNVATASVEDKTYQDDYTVDTNEKNDGEDNGGKLDTLNTTLTVNKDKITENFKTGDTVEFTVTVTNNGTVEYTNVVVKDLLKGALFESGAGYGETYTIKTDGTVLIPSLMPGKSVSVKVSCKATAADVANGKIENQASAKADPIVTPDNKTVTPEGESPVVSVPAKSEGGGEGPGGGDIVVPGGGDGDDTALLSVVKSLVNPEKTYTLDDDMLYNIVVTNTSKKTLNNIKVTDPKAVLVAGTGYTLSSDGKTAEIASLASGKSVTVNAKHAVVSEDIIAGVYKNVATASVDGKSYDSAYTTDTNKNNDKKPDGGNGGNGGDLDPLNTTLTVQKDVLTGAFAKGELVKFTIKVTNAGNVVYTNVVVDDVLDGAVIKDGTGYTVNAEGNAVITSLAPGKFITVNVEYQSNEEEFKVGKIENTATAEAKPIVTPDGDKETPKGEDHITVENDKNITPGGGSGGGGSGGGSGGSGGSGGGGSYNPPANLNTEDHYSYIIGFTDGTVRPEGLISRSEVATIFFRLLTNEARSANWNQNSGFADMHSGLWCNNAVSTLKKMQIISGYNDGTFRPEDPITRAEFTKIAVEFFDTAAEQYEGTFNDVAEGKWYTAFVEAANRVGLVKGYEDGTFRPDAYITRAEACTIVNRALNRHPVEDELLALESMVNWPDLETGKWYYADMMEATNSHDYKVNKGSSTEEWTKKLPQRDWAAFEHAWSTAQSAAGGEVVG